MSVERITFRLNLNGPYLVNIVIPETLEPEIVKEIFNDSMGSITRALKLTNAQIIFKADPEKLTNSSVAKVCGAFRNLIDALYSNHIAQKTVEEEKRDDDDVKVAKSENSIYFSNDFQAAKVKLEDAKKSTGIDIEFNDHF